MPRYFVILLRAREFAKRRGIAMTWCFAKGIPLHRDDRDLPQRQLNVKRARWLRRHDQDTAHITSCLPLVVGLPVRFTEAVDRHRSLFRGIRGFI